MDIPAYTLLDTCPTPAEVTALLINGEQVYQAFKSLRDTVVFTNKRLIAVNFQGIRGKKIEITSIPWKSVYGWSSENAGSLIDINCELKLETRAGYVHIKLGRGFDIREFDKMVASELLG